MDPRGMDQFIIRVRPFMSTIDIYDKNCIRKPEKHYKVL